MVLTGPAQATSHSNCQTQYTSKLMQPIDLDQQLIYISKYTLYFYHWQYLSTVPFWVGLNHWVQPHQKALPTSAPTWQFGVENDSVLASRKLPTGELKFHCVNQIKGLITSNINNKTLFCFLTRCTTLKVISILS